MVAAAILAAKYFISKQIDMFRGTVNRVSFSNFSNWPKIVLIQHLTVVNQSIWLWEKVYDDDRLVAVVIG